MCWNVLAKRAIKYDTWLPAQVTKSEATPCQQFPATYCWVVGPDNNQGRSTMRVKTRWWSSCCSPINQSIIASSRDLEVASQGPSYWSPSAWFEIQSSLLSPFVTSDFSRSQNLTRPKRGHKMLPAPGWLILVAGFKEHLPHFFGRLRRMDEIIWNSLELAIIWSMQRFWGGRRRESEASMANWGKVKREKEEADGRAVGLG